MVAALKFRKFGKTLSFDLRYLKGDALPLPISLDPGVGKTVAAIERFPVFAGTFFMRRANYDGDGGAIAVDCQFLVDRRFVGVLVLFSLPNQA